MLDTSLKRKTVVKELIGAPVQSLLDIGSGPISQHYPYREFAEQVTCIDFNLRVIGDAPSHITAISGDVMAHDFGSSKFNVIICADVFEHLPLESETEFARRCTSLLAPGGKLVVSVPHAGKYAILDPYQVKPGIQRQLWRLGLYRKLHNGQCDVRKGHKHYTAAELIAKFPQLEADEPVYFGYLFEPLCALALSFRRRGLPIPFTKWLDRRLAEENEIDAGVEAYSMAVVLKRR